MGRTADDRLNEPIVRRDEMIDELLEHGREHGAEGAGDVRDYRELLENMPPEELVAEYEKHLG